METSAGLFQIGQIGQIGQLPAPTVHPKALLTMNIKKSLYLFCIMTCTAKTAMECICMDQFICPDLQLGLPVSSYRGPVSMQKD